MQIIIKISSNVYVCLIDGVQVESSVQCVLDRELLAVILEYYNFTRLEYISRILFIARKWAKMLRYTGIFCVKSLNCNNWVSFPKYDLF